LYIYIVVYIYICQFLMKINLNFKINYLNSVSVLRQYELQPQFVAHLINALNQLGILWFGWE